MLRIALFTAALGVIHVGVGRLLWSPLHLGKSRGWVGQFWIGWAFAELGSAAWNLLLPVNALFLATLTALAVAGFARDPPRAPLRIAPVVGSLSLWIALSWLALGPCTNGDTGAYHLPAAVWFHRARLPIGLANLAPQLGIQSIHATWMAMLAGWPFADLGIHLGHPLLLGAFALELSSELVGSGGLRPKVVALGLLALLADLIVGRDWVSASPDLPVAIVLGRLALEVTRAETATDDRSGVWRRVVVLGAAAGGLKLSAAVTATLFVGVALFELRRERQSVWNWATVFVGAQMLALSRSALLSGWPLYPVPRLGLPVGWALPEAEVGQVFRYVRAWGRSSGVPLGSMQSWEWVRPWLVSCVAEGRGLVLPIALVLTSALAGLLSATRRHFARQTAPAALCYAGGLISWFFGSPDLRFASGLLWGLASLLVSGAVEGWAGPVRMTRPAAVTLWALSGILALWPLTGHPMPRASTWDVPPLPVAVAHPFTADSGLVLWVPTHDSCWGTTSPCTSFPARGLRQRRDGAEASGYLRASGEQGVLDGVLGGAVIPRFP